MLSFSSQTLLISSWRLLFSSLRDRFTDFNSSFYLWYTTFISSLKLSSDSGTWLSVKLFYIIETFLSLVFFCFEWDFFGEIEEDRGGLEFLGVSIADNLVEFFGFDLETDGFLSLLLFLGVLGDFNTAHDEWKLYNFSSYSKSSFRMKVAKDYFDWFLWI